MRWLNAAGPAVSLVGGTVGLHVMESDGDQVSKESAWIFDLDVPGGALRSSTPVAVDGCSVTIRATPVALRHLLFDPELVSKDQETAAVALQGDREKLKSLAKLFKAGGSMLEQRVRLSRAGKRKRRARKTEDRR